MGAAALLLLGSSAAAAWYQHRVSEREQVQIGASGAQRDQYPTSPVAPATIPSSTVANDSPNIAPAAPVVEPVEAPVRNAPSEDLLQKANRLRREGQPREAEQTYLQLVQREPQSSSAYVARVAVAELRMGRNPASALELLRTALRQSPRGPLDIEIHQLLAQGYRATGKAGLERDELLLLSQQYPGTLAADRARARLSELGDK
jgi:tetratricopeptide (TPR) repeat protein